MGRPRKFDPTLVAALEQLIGIGCSVEDACAEVGISKQTFYNWRAESIRMRELGDRKGNGFIMPDDLHILTFVDVITRAQARARVVAVMAVRTGLTGGKQSEVTTETFSETRLRKGEKGEDIPYEYKRVITRRTDREIGADWRAGIEFLKRRDPENWGDRLRVDWRSEAVTLIRGGQVEFEPLAEEVGVDLATELFNAAGIPIPTS